MLAGQAERAQEAQLFPPNKKKMHHAASFDLYLIFPLLDGTSIKEKYPPFRRQNVRGYTLHNYA